MPKRPLLLFPVWNYAHCADPYMEAIRHIHRTCATDPEREAALIGSVFDQAHNEARRVWGQSWQRAARQDAPRAPEACRG